LHFHNLPLNPGFQNGFDGSVGDSTAPKPEQSIQPDHATEVPFPRQAFGPPDAGRTSRDGGSAASLAPSADCLFVTKGLIEF
jgi:hypothetical protein